MHFDRFDICDAWYLWLSDNHGGQWSEEYAKLCRLQEYYTPGHSLSYDTLSENARAIYDQIGEKE